MCGSTFSGLLRGATFTLLAIKRYYQLRRLYPELIGAVESNGQKLHGASGNPITVLGCTKIQFQIGRMHFVYKMLIGVLKGVDALLGVDWLQAAGALIDFKKMQMLKRPFKGLQKYAGASETRRDSATSRNRPCPMHSRNRR